jgi:hypothetical protein
VFGAIALVWSKYPQLTTRQVVARLLGTVKDDVDRPGRDDATGEGIARPCNAIITNEAFHRDDAGHGRGRGPSVDIGRGSR